MFLDRQSVEEHLGNVNKNVFIFSQQNLKLHNFSLETFVHRAFKIILSGKR